MALYWLVARVVLVYECFEYCNQAFASLTDASFLNSLCICIVAMARSRWFPNGQDNHFGGQQHSQLEAFSISPYI